MSLRRISVKPSLSTRVWLLLLTPSEPKRTETQMILRPLQVTMVIIMCRTTMTTTHIVVLLLLQVTSATMIMLPVVSLSSRCIPTLQKTALPQLMTSSTAMICDTMTRITAFIEIVCDDHSTTTLRDRSTIFSTVGHCTIFLKIKSGFVSQNCSLQGL